MALFAISSDSDGRSVSDDDIVATLGEEEVCGEDTSTWD